MTIGHFLNVDLNLESATDLSPLASELEPKSVILHSGLERDGYLLVVESELTMGLEETLHDLCSLVEELSPEGRRLWQTAHKREFSVGFDGRVGHLIAEFSVGSEALQRVSRLGASLGVTVYASEETPEEAK